MSSGDPQASEPAPKSPSPETSQLENSTVENPQTANPQVDSSQEEASQAATPQADTSSSDEATSRPEAGEADAPPQATEEPNPDSPRPGAAIARGSGPLAARGLGIAKPASPQVASGGGAGKPSRSGKGKPAGQGKRPGGKQSGGKQPGQDAPSGAESATGQGTPAAGKPAAKPSGPALGPLKSQPRTKPSGVSKPQRSESQDSDEGAESAPRPSTPPVRASLPNLRQPLADDLQSLLDAELAAADVDAILSGPAGLERREQLEEGQRVRGKVLKMDDDSVYVALGGPDEGAVSRLQFEEDPEIGSTIETIVRGFNREDGLYNLVLPGQAMDVSDWEDLEEGTVVEAHVAAANTGGLEATVGNIRGFIPISQIAQYRVEDASEFVGQRLMCVVTECNPRRKNLVLSRRAVLEREREEQRQEQLEKMQPGDTLEGTVRSVKDFGAFVDLGGVDGLIHVTRLSWDHVRHPSDVLEVGQKVKVKVEKVDKQTGKIALSYRDLLENPWDTVEASFPVGSVVKGTVSRVANFGAFVRLGAGIEGLVHISELAGHRVSNTSSVVKEGDEVTVKVLSIERESQRIALSIKQAQSKAADAAAKSTEEEEEEPPRELAVKRQHRGPLKGGVGNDSGGAQFGLKW